MPIAQPAHLRLLHAQSLGEDGEAAQIVYQFPAVHRTKSYTTCVTRSSEICETPLHPKIVSFIRTMEPESLSQRSKAVGRRFKIARYAVGETDARALARKLGLSDGNVIGNWEKRGTAPNGMIVAQFVDLYPMLTTDYIWRDDRSRLLPEMLNRITEAESEIDKPTRRSKNKKNADQTASHRSAD